MQHKVCHKLATKPVWNCIALNFQGFRNAASCSHDVSDCHTVTVTDSVTMV